MEEKEYFPSGEVGQSGEPWGMGLTRTRSRSDLPALGWTLLSVRPSQASPHRTHAPSLGAPLWQFCNHIPGSVGLGWQRPVPHKFMTMCSQWGPQDKIFITNYFFRASVSPVLCYGVFSPLTSKCTYLHCQPQPVSPSLFASVHVL